MTFAFAHRVPATFGARPFATARRWRIGAPAAMTAEQRAEHYVARSPLAVIGG